MAEKSNIGLGKSLFKSGNIGSDSEDSSEPDKEFFTDKRLEKLTSVFDLDTIDQIQAPLSQKDRLRLGVLKDYDIGTRLLET